MDENWGYPYDLGNHHIDNYIIWWPSTEKSTEPEIRWAFEPSFGIMSWVGTSLLGDI